MPESVKRRGSSGPTIGAMVGLSCFGSVAMAVAEDIEVRLPAPPYAWRPYVSVLIRVRVSMDPTEESQVGPKRIMCALASVTGLLVTAAPAMAAPNTYCVSKPSCTGIVAPDFQAALDAAKAHGGS